MWRRAHGDKIYGRSRYSQANMLEQSHIALALVSQHPRLQYPLLCSPQFLRTPSSRSQFAMLRRA